MKRNLTIDIFRGLIMVLMALDHASYFVIDTHFYEGFDFITRFPSTLAFLTRWVTHLCAPGFFFVLGYGAYKNYYKSSKHKYKMLLRSVLLILLQVTIINYIWGNELRYFGVITALSFALFAVTLIMPVVKKYGLLIGIFTILMSQYAVSSSTVLTSNHLLTRLFLVPGVYENNYILYVFLPWFGLATIGAYMSSLKDIPYLKIGITLIAIFISLQFAFLKKPLTLIEGLTIVKYPPSLMFLSITMGINFIIMSLIERLQHIKLMGLLRTYGQSPLFFYIAHLYVYAYLGKLFVSTTYTTLYISWILGIILLYYPCRLYYKVRKKVL